MGEFSCSGGVDTWTTKFVYLLNSALWEDSPVRKPCIAPRRRRSSTNGRRT